MALHSSSPSSTMSMLRFVRLLATEASVSSTFRVATPPKYTLASLRSFPSLEPHSFVPLPATFFDAPVREDLLWSAVVFEADASRVGSGFVPTKGDSPYSNRKLHPQKGTGRARVGDANSPIRDNGLKAFGRKANVDFSTDLPIKVYNAAVRAAISKQYREGKIYVIGGDKATKESDGTELNFKYGHQQTTKEFVNTHKLQKLNLLFITDVQRDNLLSSTDYIGKKASVLTKEFVQVRDILKANRIFIEALALQYLIGKHTL